jgi:hypothetical protein
MSSIRVVRGLAVAVAACACLLAATAVPAASAKAPPLKQAFAPLDQRIKRISVDVSSALVATTKQTDIQAADEFAALARREAAVTIAVGRIAGARGANLNAQRQLELELAMGATELATISSAAHAHDTSRTRTATRALLTALPRIKAARIRFARALGVPA